MNIQIKRIIVYTNKGGKREVKLEPGLNIITGRSKTGKSALLDIINYCFFNRISTIPKGIIRDNANIYVLILDINDRLVVVGREEKKSNNCYVFGIDNIENLSLEEDFNSVHTISISNARTTLLRYFNIYNEEKYIDNEGSSISLRNMLPLIFQPQHLIANKYALFNGFEDFFKKKGTIEDFLFFINIANQEYISLLREIDKIEREDKKEQLSIEGKIELFADLKERIINKTKNILDTLGLNSQYSDKEILEFDLENILSEKEINFSYLKSLDTSNLSSLIDKRDELHKKIQIINNKLSTINLSSDQIDNYHTKLHRNHNMLSNIEISDKKDYNCPLCFNKVETIKEEVKDVIEIKEYFQDQINDISFYNEKITSQKKVLLGDRQNIKSEIDFLNKAISETQALHDDVKHSTYEKMLALKTEVNIEKKYWIEIKKAINNGKDENQYLKELKEKIGKFDIPTKKAEQYLNGKINSICNKLDIEERFKGNKLFFNFEDFSLSYKDNYGDIHLSEIGSGANILSLHISLFLGLLRLSLRTKSHLPKFIFFDQPSQVYFPESKDVFRNEINNIEENEKIKDEDIEKVSNLFKVILDELDEMKEKFGYYPQVIITDHANNLDLGEKYNFNDYVRKNWREKGAGLI